MGQLQDNFCISGQLQDNFCLSGHLRVSQDNFRTSSGWGATNKCKKMRKTKKWQKSQKTVKISKNIKICKNPKLVSLVKYHILKATWLYFHRLLITRHGRVLSHEVSNERTSCLRIPLP